MAVKLVLHQFNMGDVEDPYLYAGFPIGEWQKTEQGQWVMTHVVGEPVFWCDPDPAHMGYRVSITGELEEQDATYFQLKYGHKQK